MNPDNPFATYRLRFRYFTPGGYSTWFAWPLKVDAGVDYRFGTAPDSRYQFTLSGVYANGDRSPESLPVTIDSTPLGKFAVDEPCLHIALRAVFSYSSCNSIGS